MVLLKALKHLEGSRDPLPDSKQGFYLLIETTGSSQNHDRCVSVQCHSYVIYWGIYLVNRYFFSYMCNIMKFLRTCLLASVLLSEEYFVFPIIYKISLPIQGILIEHLLFRFGLVGFDSQHGTFRTDS